MNFNPASYPAIFYILTVWSLLWKGVALWRASKSGQRNWFIAMLILNTMGILEIVYLFRFAKERLSFSEIKTWRIIPEKSRR